MSINLNAIPSELLENVELKLVMDALLPRNYSFEIHKTIWQIQKHKIRKVALQMPEGLAMWACALCDILEKFTGVETVVLGDVTYGACCVDDYTAKALGCDMLVHYGHSCLIPIDQTSIRTLYVFVEITVDRRHLAETVRFNFPPRQARSRASPQIDIGLPHESSAQDVQTYNVACVGTVQFLAAVQNLGEDLKEAEARQASRLAITSGDIEDSTLVFDQIQRPINIIVPQVKPLSPGEILGCTAPKLPKETDAILYVGDGRFHLESIMIANPKLPAFRYDPYEKRLTSEGYQHAEMQSMRKEAVSLAATSLQSDNTRNWAVVLGTLGRQGSVSVLKAITKHLPEENAIPLLLSELSPGKMSLFSDAIDVFVQTSCPRLSIDWGYAFSKPLLSPYEASVALGRVEHFQTDSYAMDYWADESLGEWTPRYEVGLKAKRMKEERQARMAARQARAQTEKVK